MMNVHWLFAVVSLAGCATTQSQTAPPKIDASAVWQISPQFLATAPTSCQSSKIECLIGQMAKAGAPVAAVSFTRELHQQSHGDFGVMTKPGITGLRVGYLPLARKYQQWSLIGEWTAVHRQPRRSETARHEDDGTKFSVS